MKRIMSRLAVFAIVLGTFGGSQSFGQRKNGGVPVRIPDITPRCINGSTDQVWFTLYRVIMTKKSGIFTANNQAEVIATVTVMTKPQSVQTLSYPLSNKVNIRDYQSGQVSLPVEYTLVSGLDLKQKTGNQDVFYTGFAVNTTILNVRSESALGATLSALASFTGSKKLPIPDSPYTQAAGYLLDFANTAVQNAIADQNADDKYTTASLALNFDPTGDCSGPGPEGLGFETTGTKAVLMGEGARGNGYVPIDQTGDYCWTADVTPTFTLKSAKKVPGKACTDPGYAYIPVTNNYVAYFLQKRSISGHLGKSVAKSDMTESKKLCNALGMLDCPAAKEEH